MDNRKKTERRQQLEIGWRLEEPISLPSINKPLPQQNESLQFPRSSMMSSLRMSVVIISLHYHPSLPPELVAGIL